MQKKGNYLKKVEVIFYAKISSQLKYQDFNVIIYIFLIILRFGLLVGQNHIKVSPVMEENNQRIHP